MKINYRPEIDGLRAIAVIAVIVYHTEITILGFQPFKGGFIGVDIFFVISGYLITSIILKELIITGKFSFKNFYQRRIRRILPALIVVMIVSIPFAWMYLLPKNFIDFSKSILYSLGFGSNYYFHYTGQQYGEQSGLLKPFLHTWSLAVEEQFYILFPACLIILFRYLKKNLLVILISFFIASLVIADFGSKGYASIKFSTFYFIHTRIWELLAGSILSYCEIKFGNKFKKTKISLLMPGIGLLLIAIYIFFFDEKLLHPSFYTLLPVIGVCIIIWFSDKEELITKILSSKLFVGIGLISYSLYLWHYPIFAFSRITEFTESNIFKEIFIVILIFILSIISYFFIEQPARNKRHNFKSIFYLIIFFYSLLIIFNFNVISKKGHKQRFSNLLIEATKIISPRDMLRNSNNEKCYLKIDGCKFNTHSNKKVYLIGDSHMGSIMFNLKNRILDRNYQFISFTIGSCIYFPGFYLDGTKIKEELKNCNDYYFNNIKRILAKEKNSIIIFGGRFPLYLNNYFFDNQEGGVEGKKWTVKYISRGKYDSIETSFRNEVLNLSQKNKIILIYPIPEAGWEVPRKFLNLTKKLPYDLNNQDIKISDFITTSYEVYKNRTKSSFEFLDSITGSNVFRVYPDRLFCNSLIKNRCLTHDSENLFYVDDDHPSLKGSQMINDLIIDEIKKIESKN